MFAFLCPHCRKVWLTCKNIPMGHQAQWTLFGKEFGPDFSLLIVGAKEDCSWNIQGTATADGTFPADLTVTPSIDASASGHWHGFITAGEVR